VPVPKAVGEASRESQASGIFIPEQVLVAIAIMATGRYQLYAEVIARGVKSVVSAAQNVVAIHKKSKY